jgi:SAM-dependent methyltransferase
MILRTLLEGRTADALLLDLGCGTGGMLGDMTAHDRSRCVGMDRSLVALKICRGKGFSALLRGDGAALPFRRDAFGAVLLLDVLEHLQDDVACLERVRDVCAPGGLVVIAVPAFQMLWSQHDVTFEHVRRYTAKQLVTVVRAAGLVPERVTYTNTLLFPLAAAWRLASARLPLGRHAPKHDFVALPRPLNRLLVWIYRLEARLLSRFDLPIGLSIVCLARRPSVARSATSGAGAGRSCGTSQFR